MKDTNGIQVSELLSQGAGKLAEAGIDEARLESQLLLAHALSLTRLEVLTAPERNVGPEDRARFAGLIEDRARRIPLAYLRGTQEFYGLSFEVNPNVLIPRPETELLVDIARDVVTGSVEIWDVGTGSGCIAISCAVHCPRASIIASDVSREALSTARRNAAANRVNGRICFLQADLLAPVRPDSVTLVVSNPPYIVSDEIPLLQPEVRDYEPRLALEAGDGGIQVRLTRHAHFCLKSGGWIAVEVGLGQSEQVKDLLDRAGFREIEARKDLRGIERAVIGRKP